MGKKKGTADCGGVARLATETEETIAAAASIKALPPLPEEGGDMYAPFNDEQNRALKEFSVAVQEKYAAPVERYPYPYAMSTTTFKRFLKSRDFDVSAALAKYVEWRAWIEKEGIARYRTEEPPHNEKHKGLYPYAVGGVGKQGHPVYYERLGETHMPSFRKLTNLKDYARFHAWKNEYITQVMEKESLAQGKAIFKFIAVVDLAGLGMNHRHGMDYFSCGSEIDEKYYPETIYKVFVVNAPWVFPALWNIAKNFIDKDTQTKIDILAGGVADYSKTLLEYIDADQLPQEYGGTMQLNMPHSLHVELADEKEKKGEELETVETQVGAGKTHEIQVPISSNGHLLWYFKAESHNIDFSCDFKPKNGDKMVVVEKQRSAFHEGAMELPGEGEAVFSFCNKFSYMRSKTVKHYLSFEESK